MEVWLITEQVLLFSQPVFVMFYPCRLSFIRCQLEDPRIKFVHFIPALKCNKSVVQYPASLICKHIICIWRT